MMKSILFVVLLACVVFAQTQDATPITKTQFTADYTQTAIVSMSMPGTDTGFPASGIPGMTGKLINEAVREARALSATGDITMTTNGKIYYDSMSRRIRTDVTSLSFSVEGVIAPIVSTTKMTSLILYDINKNYTYDAKTCDCADITEPDFPVLYLTPDTVSKPATDASITVNGKVVATKNYADAVALGGINTNFNFYVDTNGNLVRSNFTVDLAGAGKMTTNFDFWNVAALPNPIGTTFNAPSYCKCPAAAAPVMNTTATFPTSCGSIINGCSCGTTELSATNFCKEFVTYQISANTFVDFTDDFVKTTFDASVAIMSPAPSAGCSSAFKKFLCNFYFPQCLADGETNKPVQPDFDTVCGGSADGAKKNDANSVYNTAAATKGGNGQSTSDSSSLSLSFFVLAAIFAALF